MKFGDTFTVEYSSDMPAYGGNIIVHRRDVQTEEFKHYIFDLDGDVAEGTRTRFTDVHGKKLKRPHIISPNAQSACGEAVKITIERMISDLVADGNDPFMRED